jgi:radical SAM superfamily enzyme YgiQ (UPF0313 family)
MSSVLPVIQPRTSHVHPAEVVRSITSKDIKGLKVVFLNMPLRESAVPTTSPEGPLLMLTNLRDNYGVDGSIIDLNGYRIVDEEATRRGLRHGRHLTMAEATSKIVRHFSRYGEPDLVALSGKITTLKWQQPLARFIKEIVPNALLVSGGGLATELKAGLFNYVPELDAVAHSEGDDVILKICYDAAVLRRRGWRGAIEAGELAPYYLGEFDGRHRLLYAGDRPGDLDRFPAADLEFLREDVDGVRLLEYYLGNPVWGVGANNSSAAPFVMTRSTTSVSSRGCPYGCKYCYRGAQGERDWHIRSARHLADELRHHVEKYQIDFKGYPDDNFAVTSGRIRDLRDILRAEGLQVRWGTHTRLDEAAGLVPKAGSSGREFVFENPLRVKLMAESGCVYIGFGPESANPDTLEVLGKGGFTLSAGMTEVQVGGEKRVFPKAMVYGIKHTLEAGIHSNCTWIMGNPSETMDRLKDTVAFMQWQDEFYAQFGIPPEAVNKRMFTLTWYPGTQLIKHPKVRSELNRVFGLNFDPVTVEPVCDDAFYRYCMELDDATKVLHGSDGRPLNFSDMPDDEFLRAREAVDSGQTLKILDM